MATQLRSTELRRGSRRQPEASRHAILQAALAEFAREGLAGARMDAIAEAAGVNKALLYYYFQDKETLYGGILDRFFERLVERVMAVCDQPGSAGQRFLAYVRTHFDSVAESPYYAHIFMSELMSASRGGSPHLDRIFEHYMRPIAGRVLGLVEEGVRRGEFRPVDPNQFLPSALGSIIHYFLTAPLRQKFMPGVDFSSPRSIQQRRAAVLDFIAAALFADRDAGIELAAKVATQPAATFRGGPAGPRKPRKQRPVVSPPSGPASEQAQTPTQATQGEVREHPSPGRYRWEDRWFPDFETGAAVLQAEKEERARRQAKRRAGRPLRRPMPKAGGEA